jgi:general stress protein YciG
MRGFAAMDPERHREIASMGGKAAHEQGTAHKFTAEEARAAGRKGHENRRRRASCGGVADIKNAPGTIAGRV